MAPNDEVTEIFACNETGLAHPPIDKGNLRTIRHAKTPAYLFTGKIMVAVFPAGSRINRFFIARVRSRKRPQNFLPRAFTGIHRTPLLQREENRSVKFQPQTLCIRCERPVCVWTFVPLETEPPQIIIHPLHKLRFASAEIEILDAQNQGPALLSCTDLRLPKGSGMAEMQIAGGRRSDAATIANRRRHISDDISARNQPLKMIMMPKSLNIARPAASV